MAVKGAPLLNHITADWYNDVTKHLRNHTGVPRLPHPDQYWYITVLNHEAVAVPKWTAVSLGSAALDYDSPLGLAHEQVIFHTAEYDSADPDNLAILLEPLPGIIGGAAKALLCGVSWMRVPEALGTNSPYIHIEDIEPSLIPGLAYSNSGRIEILRTFLFEPPISPPGTPFYSLMMFGPSGMMPGMLLGPTNGISPPDDWPYSGDTGYLGLAIIGKKVTRGIIDLRVDGFNLQYTFDGVTWTTWHTGDDCTPVTS